MRNKRKGWGYQVKEHRGASSKKKKKISLFRLIKKQSGNQGHEKSKAAPFLRKKKTEGEKLEIEEKNRWAACYFLSWKQSEIKSRIWFIEGTRYLSSFPSERIQLLTRHGEIFWLGEILKSIEIISPKSDGESSRIWL